MLCDPLNPMPVVVNVIVEFQGLVSISRVRGPSFVLLFCADKRPWLLAYRPGFNIFYSFCNLSFEHLIEFCIIH